VGVDAARQHHSARLVDIAILEVWRRLAVPVNDRVLAGSVEELDQETIARVDCDAGCPVRLENAEGGRGASPHFDRPALDGQLDRRGTQCAGPTGRRGARQNGSRPGEQGTSANLKAHVVLPSADQRKRALRRRAARHLTTSPESESFPAKVAFL